MDTLVKAIERLGGEIRLDGPGWGEHHYVFFAGERVTVIRLREKYKQTPRKTQPTDSWDSLSVDYVPLGLFVLDAGPSYSDKALARDTATHRIEEDLNELIVGWVRSALARRRGREEDQRLREEQEVRRRELEAEKERQQADAKKRRHAEQSRQEHLLRAVIGWHAAKLIRDYLTAVERDGETRHKDGSEMPGELTSWLKWARDYADRLDRLLESPMICLKRVREQPPELRSAVTGPLVHHRYPRRCPSPEAPSAASSQCPETGAL